LEKLEDTLGKRGEKRRRTNGGIRVTYCSDEGIPLGGGGEEGVMENARARQSKGRGVRGERKGIAEGIEKVRNERSQLEIGDGGATKEKKEKKKSRNERFNVTIEETFGKGGGREEIPVLGFIEWMPA